MPTDNLQRMKQLEGELRELRRANIVAKAAPLFTPAELIDVHRETHAPAE